MGLEVFSLGPGNFYKRGGAPVDKDDSQGKEKEEQSPIAHVKALMPPPTNHRTAA